MVGWLTGGCIIIGLMKSQPTTTSGGPGLVRAFPLAMMSNAFSAVTWAVLLVVGGLVAALLVAGFSLPSGWGIAAWLTAGVVALALTAAGVIVHSYARPRSFNVSAEGLEIVWPARTRKLPWGAFVEICEIDRISLGPMTRRFGLGILLGQFGWFHSMYMGNIDSYITRRDGLVLIKLRNRRPLLLSPQAPGEFLQAVRAAISEVEKTEKAAK